MSPIIPFIDFNAISKINLISMSSLDIIPVEYLPKLGNPAAVAEREKSYMKNGPTKRRKT